MDVMGVLQHHDAITGTEKQAVADDYSENLSKAMAKSNDAYGHLLNQQLLEMTGLKVPNLEVCSQPQNDTVVYCP